VLVVEDTESNEILRFVMVDASVQLGEVRVAEQVKKFDPERLLAYCKMVEQHLMSLASKYPESYKYLPRKSYEYLKPPPILGDVYQGLSKGWFIDFFLVKPLARIGRVPLPSDQKRSNRRLARQWCINSRYAPRLYATQDLRYGAADGRGWVCTVRAEDLPEVFKGPARNDVLHHIKQSGPFQVELDEESDVDHLLKWLVRIRELGLDTPPVLVAPRVYGNWVVPLTRLLEIDGVRVLTTGATIAELSSLIRRLREQLGSEWSTKILFASSYPETQLGDSIAEILSFLLSKSIEATPKDLHRILGGNMLGLLPPRPAFLQCQESRASIAVEGSLGRASAKEVARFLQVLVRRTDIGVTSVDYMVTPEGVVDTDNMVLTLVEDPMTPARCLALRIERDGTLITAGWRNSFDETLAVRRADVYATLIRKAATSGGIVLDSPSHLNQFGHFLVQCLRLRDGGEILSALHYRVRVGDEEPGRVGMHRSDMNTLGIADDDVVLVLVADPKHWWGGFVRERRNLKPHEISVAAGDGALFSLTDGASVDIVRYDSSIQDITKAVFSFHTDRGDLTAEDSALVYLHEREIVSSLRPTLVGIGTQAHLGLTGTPITATLIDSDPPLLEGQLARLRDAAIRWVPRILLRSMNVILCISLDAGMDAADVEIKTLYSVRHRLSSLAELVPEVKKFVGDLDSLVTRAEGAAVLGLLALAGLSANRSEGRLGLITVTDRAEKFSIQKGENVQYYASFSEDISSQEVQISLIYSILDAMRESSSRTEMSDAYRAVAELLEDFGDDLPTLILVVGDSVKDPDEDPSAFLRAIASHTRYRLDFLALGSNINTEAAKSTFEEINGSVVRMTQISIVDFENYLFSAARNI